MTENLRRALQSARISQQREVFPKGTDRCLLIFRTRDPVEPRLPFDKPNAVPKQMSIAALRMFTVASSKRASHRATTVACMMA